MKDSSPVVTLKFCKRLRANFNHFLGKCGGKVVLLHQLSALEVLNYAYYCGILPYYRDYFVSLHGD